MTHLRNLLVLSDVHLGSDLVHHARPEAPERGRASEQRDRDLVAFLEWYRERPRGGRPWRLVIAGDFVDFVGMSVIGLPGDLETALNEEERENGLGGAADHTLAKLAMVARHHEAVFRALARFVAAGHELVMLRGNHDVDLHWGTVQAELRRLLAEHANLEAGSVEFADWFYYEEGRVYIEHGHQYDSYCSYDHLMHPVHPGDTRRTSRSLSDVLLRYVVRPTRGMSESGHEGASVYDYCRFAARLGVRGMAGLARRFFVAVAALIAIWRSHFDGAAAWVRGEHERKMRLLGEAKQISLERLRALAKLQRPPVTRSLSLILASVMLDRIVVAVSAAALAVVAVGLADDWVESFAAIAFVAACGAATGFVWAKVRKPIDPSEALRSSAPRIVKLFPAAFVVMGHTHLPEISVVPSANTTYVNLGAWGEDDVEDGARPALPATRTHLVLSDLEGELVGELLAWDSTRGPQRFAPGFERADSPFTRG